MVLLGLFLRKGVIILVFIVFASTVRILAVSFKLLFFLFLSPAVDVAVLLHVDDFVIPQQFVELYEGLSDLLLLPNLLQDQVVIQLMIMGIIRSSTIISSSCYLFDHLDNSRCLVWSEDSGVKVTVIVITILS